jgi:hypothetical protein
MLDEQTKSQCTFINKYDLSKYYVRIRYSLESYIDFRTELAGVLGEKYYSTIADFNWLENVYQKSKSLLEYASSKNPPNLEPINLAEIDVQSVLDKHARLRDIRDKKSNKS